MNLGISSVFAVVALFSAFTLSNPASAQVAATSGSDCSTPSTGNPCFGTGNNPELNKSVANPINLTNGNKYQKELDYWGGDANSGLEFYRYYNSTQLTPSLIGQGWRHSYNRKLYWRSNRVQILLDDSTRLLFEPPQGDTAQSRFNEYGSLQKIKLSGAMERLDWSKSTNGRKSVSEFFSDGYLQTLQDALWLWEYPSGALDVFNSHGNLIISQMPFEEAIFIEREIKPGPTYEAILKVQNLNQQSMDFHYAILGNRARLSQIDTPAGSLKFKHDIPHGSEEPRLLTAYHTDNAKIAYQYITEPNDEGLSPYLLTRARHYAVDNNEPYRDVSWNYDTWGRATAVDIYRHEQLAKPLSMQLNYLKIPHYNGDTGITEITQTQDSQKTLSRFHTKMLGSQYLLSKAEGAPCFGCPAPGTEAQYNIYGQIIGFNGLSIRRRGTDNSIESIGINHRGWPGLRIYYDSDGTPHGWSSLHTGKTLYELDPDTLFPKYKSFANKTRMYGTHKEDKGSRLIRYGQSLGSYDASAPRSLLTKFNRDTFILSNQNDKKNLNIQKRSQSINLRTTRWWDNRKESRLNELFTPYYADNIVEHQLPEWGKLYYQYDDNKQLKTIYWQPTNAAKEDKWKIVYQRVNSHERTYGNNLKVIARQNPSFIKNSTKLEIFKTDDEKPYWAEIRYYHSDGLLAAEHHLSSNLNINKFRQYQFNPYGQLIRVDTDLNNIKTTETDLYAWELGGAAFARQHKSKVTTEGYIEKQDNLIIKDIERDKAGFIKRMDNLELIYDERNLLTEIRQDNKSIANYIYDALNQRIRKVTSKGETQYYYLNQQLVAEAFIPTDAINPNYGDYSLERSFISRRYIYDGVLPVAFIDYSKDIDGDIYYIHSDGSGQPFLVTDSFQKPVWLADNEVFGQSQALIEEVEFNLRLPGQYYDVESGLHQNLYRNYDPEVGHYLEPDPLGPISSNDAFGYANQNPRQFIDPLGLLMFVFDGTTNTPSSQTNAYKLGQLYDDGPVNYLEGIGTKEAQNKAVDFFENYQKELAKTHPVHQDKRRQRGFAFSILEWRVPEFMTHISEDKIYATMTPYLLNMQWMQLIDEMIHATSTGPLIDNTINIDLSGFSRGAALASIFANKINQYTKHGYFQYTAKWLPPGQQYINACINLRFVGLFDTVHQLGALGNNNNNYNYTVSPAWATFAHAVALNEHRKIMPLTSFSDENADNIHEQGFLGNHSDIGGAIFQKDLNAIINPYKGTYGDLSNIPLAWIHYMATDAQVKLKPLDSLTQWQLDTVKNPLLHLNGKYDQTSESSRWLLVDREVYSTSGDSLGSQSSFKPLGGAVRVEHVKNVRFPLNPYMSAIPSNNTGGAPYGIVNAQEYIDFLSNAINWNSTLKVIPHPEVVVR